MSNKWVRLFLIIAILALNFAVSVGAVKAQTQYVTYVVQPGDTLGKIAARYCTTWVDIYNLNRNVIYNPNVIYAGMVLTVPSNCGGGDGGSGTGTGACVDNGPRLHASGTYSAPYYTVVWGDTLYSIGLRFGMNWWNIAKANGISYAYIYAGQRLQIPCTGGSTTPPPSNQPAPPITVTFPPGATSVTMAGSINQAVPASYSLRASEGQTMTVQTVSRGDALVISIASGANLLPLTGTNSQVSNTVSTRLPVTGDYIVTIRPVTAPESPTLGFDITFTIQ